MAAPSVSVIVVSRGRPDALCLCLTGLAQLDYPSFEIVVVACPEGLAATAARPDAGLIRTIPCDTPNISLARNLGVAAAAGEICAFIDDDAVPEPTWLQHLVAPFRDPQVAAAGGYVRGRNGIAFQWQGRTVTPKGEEADLPLDSDGPEVFAPEPGRAVKLQGTNMAHRRDILAAMGGFDPAFRFYLDETDLDLRHAAAGHAVAVVPLAQVHHGYAESDRRAADRTPRDLSEIGASVAVFLRKHCPEPARAAAWDRIRAEQRRRLLGLMQRGPLGPDDVLRLLRGLDRGYREGLARGLAQPVALPDTETAFLPYPGRPGAPRAVISGRVWQRTRMRREAESLVREGRIVSVFRFSHSLLYHRLRFRSGGYWEQIGGLWGRSDRSRRALLPGLLSTRVQSEVARIAVIRGISARNSTEAEGGR